MPWWQQNLINARILRAADGGGDGGGGDGGGDQGGDKGGGDKGGDKTSQVPGWMHQMSEANRAALQPYGFKSVDDLGSFALKHADIAGKVDKAIFLPGDGEDRSAFRKAFGVPEKPDAYDFGIKDVPPEYVDQNFAKFAGELFQSADIADWQGAKLAAGWNKHMLDTVKAAQKARADQRAAEEANLATAMGARMDEGVATAKRVLSHFGVQGEGDGGVEAMLDAMSSVMGYDKAVIALTKMAGSIAGDGPAPRGAGDKTFTINDPATADAKRAQLLKDNAHIMNDDTHPQYKALWAQYDQLLTAKHGVKG